MHLGVGTSTARHQRNEPPRNGLSRVLGPYTLSLLEHLLPHLMLVGPKCGYDLPVVLRRAPYELRCTGDGQYFFNGLLGLQLQLPGVQLSEIYALVVGDV